MGKNQHHAYTKHIIQNFLDLAHHPDCPIEGLILSTASEYIKQSVIRASDADSMADMCRINIEILQDCIIGIERGIKGFTKSENSLKE